jgi:hypothetical protein
MTRTRVLAVLAGLAVAGIVAASAAQLDVNADDLGAGVTTVASCDDAVDVEFTGITYNGALGIPQLTEVTVTGIAEECETQDLTLTLVDDATDTILGEVTDVVVTTSLELDVTADEIDAELVTLVAVVITGEPA